MSDATEVKGMVAADEPDTSLLDFYRTMDVKGRRTFWAATGGWTLDGMDFMLFPLAIGTLATVLHSDMKTMGGIVSVTVLCSAVGGWLSGYLSDRIGRVRTMQITILLFSLGSLLSAFAQDVTQLTLARMVLGVGFGGEAAVAGRGLVGSRCGQISRPRHGLLPVELCRRLGACPSGAGPRRYPVVAGHVVARDVRRWRTTCAIDLFHPPQRGGTRNLA